MIRTMPQALLVLAVLGLGLSAAGLVLEHGFGVLPCEMCWWQRFAHYGIAALALAGLLLPAWPYRKWFLLGIGVCALAGLGVAIWQFAAQHGWLPFPPSCRSSGLALSGGADLLAAVQTTTIVPCDRENFLLLGLSLAGWNMPAMLAVLEVAWTGWRTR